MSSETDDIPSNPSFSSDADSSMDDEIVCRICRSADSRPLFHPCACSGSIKYIHDDCLSQWLQHSRTNKCELCNQEFRFTPIYAPDAPVKLSFSEIISGALLKLSKTAKSVLRFLSVVLLWLFMLPLLTSWTWSFFMTRGWGELKEAMWTRFSVRSLMYDTSTGLVISATILCCFLSLIAFRDYVFANGDIFVVPFRELNQMPPQQRARHRRRQHAAAEGEGGEVEDDGGIDQQQQEPEGGEGDWIDDHHQHDEDAGGPLEHEGDLDPFDDEEEGGVFIDELDFEEIVGLKGPIIHLVENFATALVCNVVVGFLLLFLPFSFGRLWMRFGPQPTRQFTSSLLDLSSSTFSSLFNPNSTLSTTISQVVNTTTIAIPMTPGSIPAYRTNFFSMMGNGTKVFLPFFGAVEPGPTMLENFGCVMVGYSVLIMFCALFVTLSVLYTKSKLKLYLKLEERLQMTQRQQQQQLMHQQNSEQSVENMRQDEAAEISVEDEESEEQSSLREQGNEIQPRKCSVIAKLDDPRFDPMYDNFAALRAMILAEQQGDPPTKSFSQFCEQLEIVEQQDNQNLENSIFGEEEMVPTNSDVENDAIRVNESGGVQQQQGQQEQEGAQSVAEDGPLQLTLRLERPQLNLLARALLNICYFVYVFSKLCTVLAVEMIGFPLFCGFFLDFATCEFFGSSFGARLQFAIRAPVASFALHWLVGVIYVIQLSYHISSLREVVRPYVLWFLRNPDDPNFNLLRHIIVSRIPRHVRRVSLTLSMFSVLILLLVRMPLKFSRSLFSDVFPLSFQVSDLSLEIFVDVLTIRVLFPFVTAQLRPKETLKIIYHRWLSAVGTRLGIHSYLFGTMPQHQNENENDDFPENGGVGEGGGAEPPNQNAENDLQNGNQNRIGDLVFFRVDPLTHEITMRWLVPKPYLFEMRILCLLLLSWSTLLVASSALLLAPLLTGRLFFSALLFATKAPRLFNDIYSFTVGLCILVAIRSGVMFVAKKLREQRAKEVVSTVFKYMVPTFKCVLLLLCTAVLNFLFGLTLDLTFLVPLRVPPETSLLVNFEMDCQLGLLMAVSLTWLGELVPGLNWLSAEFQVIYQNGFIGLDFTRVFTKIMFPVFMFFATFLCVPYTVCYAILPLFGVSFAEISRAHHLSYPILFSLFLVAVSWRGAVSFLSRLHNSIRDEKYLVGRQLSNFNRPEAQAPTTPSTDVSSGGSSELLPTETATTEITHSELLSDGLELKQEPSHEQADVR